MEEFYMHITEKEVNQKTLHTLRFNDMTFWEG